MSHGSPFVESWNAACIRCGFVGYHGISRLAAQITERNSNYRIMDFICLGSHFFEKHPLPLLHNFGNIYTSVLHHECKTAPWILFSPKLVSQFGPQKS